MKTKQESNGDKPESGAPGTSRDEKKVVMCWKDPNKVCKCTQPQQGVYCGRYPLATD